MKTFKSTLILLGLGVALLAYILLFEKGPKKDDSEKKDKIFTTFVADDVQEIRVEYPSNTLPAHKPPLTLKKDDKGIWQITQPVQLQADETLVRQALTNIGQLNPEDTLSAPGNLSEYGLVNPYAKLSFISKGKNPDVLVIGDKTINGNDFYCLNPSLKSVFLIQPYMAEGFMKVPNEIRDHTLIKTDQVAAEKVEIDYQGKSLLLAKDDKNNWSLEKPVREKADSNKLRDFLNSINTQRIDDFVEDHPSNLAAYGLSSPRASIEIWPSDHTGPKTLLLGRQKLKTASYFAKMKDQPAVFLVAGFFDTTLNFKLNDFRDKSVMGFDATQVKLLSVTHNKQVYAYQKDAKGQWTSPGRLQAPTEASAIISGLAQTTIADFVDSKVQTGVENPSYTAEVTLNDGTIRKFQFGRREKEQVYLASDKGKEVYLVSASTLSLLESYFNVLLTPLPVTTPQK